MSAPVFISHATKDRQVAQTICNALEKRGLTCWIASRDVGPGENFQETIVRAIRGATVMVLVFSDAANNSSEIKKELALASQQGLVVIPARIEDIVPTEALAYELVTRQWINLFDNWEQEIERLAKWIAVTVANAPARPQPSAVPTPSSVPPQSEALEPQAIASPIPVSPSSASPNPAPPIPASPEPNSPDTEPSKPEAPTPQAVAAPAATPSQRCIRIVGILLTAWGLVRLGFTAQFVLTLPSYAKPLVDHLDLAFLNIVLPALLGIATIAAGIMILKNRRRARVVGLTVCVVCLLYALNGLSSVIFSSRAWSRLPVTYWLFTASAILLYAVAIAVIARWRPPPQRT